MPSEDTIPKQPAPNAAKRERFQSDEQQTGFQAREKAIDVHFEQQHRDAEKLVRIQIFLSGQIERDLDDFLQQQRRKHDVAVAKRDAELAMRRAAEADAS